MQKDFIMEKIVNILFALLRFELSGQELSKDIKNSVSAEIFPSLFQFAKKHDLAHLVGDALERNDLLPDGTEAKKRFLQERNMAIFRHEQKRYEYGQICATLEKAQIPFIPLKGAVIQDFYPQAWMRTSCDIDILVEENNLNAAIDVLKKELEYTCDFIGGHDAQIFAPNGVHLELHYTLLDGDLTPERKEFFEKVWEYDAESEHFQRRMSKEHFYGYFLLHTAKHVKEGGCGVRPFLDVWLMLNKEEFRGERVEKTLKAMGLFAFAKAVESLSDVWFSGTPATELDQEFADYVLSGGVYGTMQNRVIVQTNRKKGKFRFILSRIFLPYSELKIKYPRLKKYPVLFPFYQVKRWFNLLNKDRREQSVREWKATMNGDEEKTERVANLLQNLEL